MFRLIDNINRILDKIAEFINGKCHRCKYFRISTIRCFYCRKADAFELMEED